MAFFLLVIFVVMPLLALVIIASSRGSEQRAIELHARAAHERISRENPESHLAALGQNEFVQHYTEAFRRRSKAAMRRFLGIFAATFLSTALLIPILTVVAKAVFGGREAAPMAATFGVLVLVAGTVVAIVAWRRKLREDVLSYLPAAT